MRIHLSALLVFILSLGLFAKKPDFVDVFTPYITPDMITLQPEADYAHYELVVTGPHDFLHREIFDGRHVPFFEIFDAAGMILPDGQYTFELRATPHIGDEVKAAMLQARATGDESIIKALKAGGDMPEGFVYTGTLHVRDGGIVLPDQGELIYEAADGRDDGAVPGTPIVTPEVTSDDSGVDSDDPNRDVFHSDDLIVKNSLCVGVDCDNGEVFSYDTIRLKENNLRIKFQDTSNSSSFPSTDWQLTANESTNGGKNKFSIEDVTAGRIPFTIEGNAKDHSLYVKENGNVGIGTTVPSLNLQITHGNSPSLRLEQNGSSGFNRQIWDVGGNEINFFVRDSSNSGKLPFRIAVGAPGSSLFVSANGDIGLSTQTPNEALEILRRDGSASMLVREASTTEDERILLTLRNNGGVGLRLEDDSADGSVWTIRGADPKTLKFSENDDNFMQLNHTADLRIEAADTPSIYLKSNAANQANRTMLTLENNGGPIMAMHNTAANGGSGNIWNIISQGNNSLTFNATANSGTEVIFAGDGQITAGGVVLTSDVNMKENFEEVTAQDILQGVVGLDITRWNFIHSQDDVRHLGPMAQDFYAAFGLGDSDTGINSTDANGVAFASIQALHQLFRNQQAAIAEKNARIQTLEKQVSKMNVLEQRLAAMSAFEQRLAALETKFADD